jgi:anaerobic selenocysteine-containing dehydrogenase
VQGTQITPFVQWTGPVVEARGERQTEQWIFAELAARMGHDPVFGTDGDVLSMLYDGSLAEHGLSMASLRADADGVAVLAPTEPGGFLDRTTADGTLDGAPEMLEPARRRAQAQFEELLAEPAHQLKLITRRTSHTINSAMQNVERLKKGLGADNPLFLSPADAERLAVADGTVVRISNRFGSIEALASIDDTLRPGVVAMTHGFGNAATSGQPVAQRFPGVNVNALAPVGPGTCDPVSTMSQLTGIPVEVVPV